MTKDTGSKKKNQSKKLVWRSFSVADYQQTAMEMVHFSAKTVNSKTPAFGIRLASSFNLDLPYVAMSTIDKTDVPMDYMKNVKSTYAIAKQINALLHEELDAFEEVPQTDIDAILNCTDLFNSNYEPDGTIGIRLRQIILQDASGNDIAASPLPCAGLSHLLNKRVQEEFDRENPLNEKNKRPNDKKFIRRKHAYLGIGGAKPQNVGLNVRAMQKPLMFKVPMLDDESREVKHALSIYYKGIPIKPNSLIMKEFIIWQENLLAHYFEIKPTNLNIRTKESEFLISITNEFMMRITTIEKMLRDNVAKLPTEKIYSKDLPDVQKGLLDSTLRTMKWRRDFSAALHCAIIGESVWVNNQQKALKGSESETIRWRKIIEGTLL